MVRWLGALPCLVGIYDGTVPVRGTSHLWSEIAVHCHLLWSNSAHHLFCRWRKLSLELLKW